MATGQEDNRVAGVNPHKEWSDEVHGHVGLARGGELGDPSGVGASDIVHLGEPLALQEFAGDVLRGHTGSGGPNDPERRRLRRWLCGHRPEI
jgi:hypothetical protein